MPTNHIMAASMYILSGFLDAFDGHAARALNQGTVIALWKKVEWFLLWAYFSFILPVLITGDVWKFVSEFPAANRVDQSVKISWDLNLDSGCYRLLRIPPEPGLCISNICHTFGTLCCGAHTMCNSLHSQLYTSIHTHTLWKVASNLSFSASNRIV